MAAEAKQSAALTSPGYLAPFIIVTALFFIFGFVCFFMEYGRLYFIKGILCYF